MPLSLPGANGSSTILCAPTAVGGGVGAGGAARSASAFVVTSVPAAVAPATRKSRRVDVMARDYTPAMAIELRRFTACDEFVAVAGAFLAAREAEHNLMLGLTHTILAHPEIYPEHWLAVALDDGRVA